MKRIFLAVLTFLIPGLILAQSGGALSFAPPPSDYSMVFLGNIFGVVDGVLHGTGSQVMGNMMGVFNAAVMALGGIIIMYTLMVSTMNTAQEGEMLGKQWSSIWIPVRSTIGLALLIPKASGYCMMQIFVMWVVVQGVGAADKVWQATLDYLNRGGVIIQAQTDPTKALLGNSSSGIAAGASQILSGQICMLGLEKVLQRQRLGYTRAAQNNSGPCAGNPTGSIGKFCNSAVPDFLSTVNIVAAQTNNPKANSFSVNMPNFDSSSEYAFLNGICGTIKWDAFPAANVSTITANIPSISSGDIQTIEMSRAIGIQQIYLDLSMVSRAMVNNDPTLSSDTFMSTTNFSPVAKVQFGVPLNPDGSICTATSPSAANPCTGWGVLPGASGAPLFNGTEFQGALSDYDGIMKPTLNLMQQAKDSKSAKDARAFIQGAEQQGWIMAGAYFFDLVRLNGSATSGSDEQDTNTGLDNSVATPEALLSAFGQNSCSGNYAMLCTWLNSDKTKVQPVLGLINGTSFSDTPAPEPNTRPNASPDSQILTNGQLSSTVYGFVNNSLMVRQAGQPGANATLNFDKIVHFSADPSKLKLQPQGFDCGRVKILVFSFCLGEMLGDIFYNKIFLFVYNYLLSAVNQLINQVIMAFLELPLIGATQIFKEGVKVLSEPGVNPIVALANMGTMYINFSGNLWLQLLELSVITGLIPIFGSFIFALIALAMPLVLAWVGIMVGIGFTTAYYIPILPYMIFTFGTIGWLISVIEAMVAAPIVALGVTHPEGHQAFGKAEQAIMILMNVFLRPAMMIIGYVSAIALSYVGVWLLNAGFNHAIGFIQGPVIDTAGTSFGGFKGESFNVDNSLKNTVGSGTGGYTEWAGIYAFFFSILIYTTIYLIIVQRSFTLITYLPDKILRWIGGTPEGIGQETAGWTEEGKRQVGDASKPTQDAQGQIDKQLSGYGQKGVGKAKGAMSGLIKGNKGGSVSGTSVGSDSSDSGGG